MRHREGSGIHHQIRESLNRNICVEQIVVLPGFRDFVIAVNKDEDFFTRFQFQADADNRLFPGLYRRNCHLCQ